MDSMTEAELDDSKAMPVKRILGSRGAATIRTRSWSYSSSSSSCSRRCRRR